jgi:flagellar basal body-associated protein FliL
VPSTRSINPRAVALALLLAVGMAGPALANEGGGPGGGEEKKAPVSLFVPVGPLSLSMTRFDERRIGILDLRLTIEAADEASAGRITTALPRIRDRLLTEINPRTEGNSVHLSAEALNELKSRILMLVRDLMGYDKVKAVYIQSAMTQRV